MLFNEWLDEGSFAAPHATVVAPPFGIVEVTVRHQVYEGTECDDLPPVFNCLRAQDPNNWLFFYQRHSANMAGVFLGPMSETWLI